MKLVLSFLILLSFNSFAGNLKNAPQDFKVEGKNFNFVDIETADYKITYDAKAQTASYYAHLKFTMDNDGYALFDVVTPAETLSLRTDGTRFEEAVDAKLVSLPENTSSMYAVDKLLSAGTYHLRLTGKITELVKFNEKMVRSAFWMSDLSDRSFLEKYLPSNLDYDQMAMSLDVEIKNSDKEHLLMINCEKKLVSDNHWQATCPAFYTSSLLFYHLFEKGAYEVEEFDYKSIDNRILKMTVYTNETMESYTSLTKKVMAELERDYGPWLHDGLIIYGTGGQFGGGMEYAGATLTSLRALGHELHHSYFARAMAPAGGNAGWIDEALASWRDKNYPRGGALSRTQMGGHTEYRRSTDRGAYTKGMSFIANLDKKFADKNGLLPFLKEYGQTYKYQTFTTPFFQQKLEDYFNTDLSDLFETYIYGKNGINKKGMLFVEENPYHPHLTKKELESLL